MTIEHTTATKPAAAWVKPSVRKISAGDAENAPNPNRPDGAFSSGS